MSSSHSVVNDAGETVIEDNQSITDILVDGATVTEENQNITDMPVDGTIVTEKNQNIAGIPVDTAIVTEENQNLEYSSITDISVMSHLETVSEGIRGYMNYGDVSGIITTYPAYFVWLS